MDRAGELFEDGMVVDEASFFPSLEVLHLWELIHCEGVSVGGEKGRAFTCLARLTIRKCPKLKYVQLRQLTALERVEVEGCEELTTLDMQHMQDPVVTSPQGEPSSSSSLELPRSPPPELKPLSTHVQQLLPPSVKKLVVMKCPLLRGWLETHRDSLVSLPWLCYDRGPLSLRNVVPLEEVTKEYYKYKDGHLLLGNVADVKEASTYQYDLLFLAGRLELRWDVEYQRVTFSAEEAEWVLNKLIPDDCLEELVIRGYRGRSFPSWVGDPHFRRLLGMTLTGCLHCEHLPPLGLLPALEQLHISNMGEVRHVGREFCGNSGGGFPSLRILEFHDMPKWEEWEGAEEDVGKFPSLQCLNIYNCPKLKPFKPANLRQTELESGKFCWDRSSTTST